MKRDRRLETLSWEHHNGLVLAYRLQKGKELSADPEEMARYLLHVWHEALSKHFALEEKILAAYRKYQGLEDLFNRMFADHRNCNDLIGVIQKAKEGQQLVEKTEEFKNLLREHIRFEERELFPALEKSLPDHLLDEIGRELHARHTPVEMSWPIRFWSPGESTGNRR